MTPKEKAPTAMRIKLTITALLLLASVAIAQTPNRSDTWDQFRTLVGIWEGTGSGQPGVSKIEREYQLVLNEKFLHVRNKSTYDPQPKNPKGEIHRDWGMMNFDKARGGRLRRPR